MSWVIKTLSSSLGKKLLVSLTGLFLILFLIIHLAGNLAVFKEDGGLTFNAYAAFMSTNPLIEVVSYLLYASILLHIFVATFLWFVNKQARPVGYAKLNASENSSWASRSMLLLGSLVFAFLFIHLKDFWWYYKVAGGYDFGMDSENHRDLYALVITQFKSTFSLLAYLIGLVALSFHLWHGFQSAFQTLGISHHKYTPAIKAIGYAFSILVPLAFAAMPVYCYFFL